MANANDRQQVQERGTRERAERKTDLADIRELMLTGWGRRLAWRVLEQTGAERVVPFQPNAMNLAHDMGVRTLGLWLLGEIRAAAPEQELAMRREAAKRADRIDLQEEADER